MALPEFPGPEIDDQERLSLVKLTMMIWAMLGRPKNLALVTGAPAAGQPNYGTQTLASSAAITSGSVAAGARSVAFSFSSDWSGSVNGVTRPASGTLFITANSGYTLPAIAYVRTTGTITIDTLT